MLKITHDFNNVTVTERRRVKIREVGARRWQVVTSVLKKQSKRVRVDECYETRGTRETEGVIYHLEVVFC